MGTKLKAIKAILFGRKFILFTIPKDTLRITVVKHGSEELSANILIMTEILRVYDETKTKVEEQAADAGQLRNLKAIREAVQAIELSDERE